MPAPITTAWEFGVVFISTICFRIEVLVSPCVALRRARPPWRRSLGGRVNRTSIGLCGRLGRSS